MMSPESNGLAQAAERWRAQGMTCEEIARRFEVAGSAVPAGFGLSWSAGVVRSLLGRLALARQGSPSIQTFRRKGA